MNAVARALYTKLSNWGDLTTELGGTKIYELKIPQRVSLPAVRFFYSGGGEENLTPVRSINVVYAVLGVSSVSMKKAGAIAEFIDAALHGKTLTISDWTNNFWTAREGLISFHELGKAGEDIWTAGAYYRIRAD